MTSWRRVRDAAGRERAGASRSGTPRSVNAQGRRVQGRHAQGNRVRGCRIHRCRADSGAALRERSGKLRSQVPTGQRYRAQGAFKEHSGIPTGHGCHVQGAAFRCSDRTEAGEARPEEGGYAGTIKKTDRMLMKIPDGTACPETRPFSLFVPPQAFHTPDTTAEHTSGSPRFRHGQSALTAHPLKKKERRKPLHLSYFRQAHAGLSVRR